MRNLAALLALLGAACGDDGATPIDAAPPTDSEPAIDADEPDGPTPDANPVPGTLAETGLCMDDGCTVINPAARPYRPKYELWSDTATKRRWVMLPAGTTIDTTDMDFWTFPVGTKFFKEFTRDGTRVETRMIVKVLADEESTIAWSYITYQWNAEQTAATAVTMGVTDANGTGHDIPSRATCRECHDQVRPSRVLGFGALQLDFDAEAGQVDLDTLIAEGLLSAPPAGAVSPRFALPGGATEQAALGYLHANCGTCHNPTSANFGHTQVNLRLVTTQLATLAETPIYATAVGQPGLAYTEGGTSYPTIIVPGDPDTSALIVRMNSTNAARRMPYRGSEITDPTGLAALRLWIEAME